MKHYLSLFLFMLLSLLLCAQPVAEVRIGENIKYDGHVLRSSAAETWILWDDSALHGYEIHAQKYDSLGNAAFDPPLTIASSGNSVKLLDAVASSDNGLVLLFMQETGLGHNPVDFQVQKLNSQGQRQWTDSGIYVAQVADIKFPGSRLCANNLGGAFLAYNGYDSQGPTITRFSNYDAAGNNIWTADNEAGYYYSAYRDQLLLTAAGDLIINLYAWQNSYLRKVDNNGNTVGSFPMFAPDAVLPEDPLFQKAANGNILIYSANYDSVNPLSMQMMDANANLVYSTLKQLSMSSESSQDILKIEPLLAGGFILAYHSSYNDSGVLRAQRLTATLEPVWGSVNPLILTGEHQIVESALKVDSSDQAWLAVLRSSSNFDLMQVEMVKLNPDGSPAFSPQLVSSPTGFKTNIGYSLLTDKAMLFWHDDLGGQVSLRRQMFTANGDQLLTENGAPIVSKLDGDAEIYDIYSLGNRTVCLMHDTSGQNQQIYYQILDNDMSQYLPANGQALDLSDDCNQTILAAKVSPQNTLFIIYCKELYPAYELYVQELDTNGNTLHPGNGILLSSSNSSGYGVALGFADNSVCIYWTHSLGAPSYKRIIKGQKIEAGATVWGEGGIEIYDSIGKNVATMDAQGRYLIFKCDNYISHRNELRALYILPTGAVDPAWNPEGVLLINSDTWLTSIILGFKAGMIDDELYCFDFTKNLSQEYSLRAQKVDASGNTQWGDEGLQICFTDYLMPDLLSSIFTHEINILYRCPGQGIFLQKLDAEGNLGFAGLGISLPSSDTSYSPATLTQHANGSYSYFWLEYETNGKLSQEHMYIHPDGSFGESQTFHSANICDLRSVNCDNSAVLYWIQYNIDYLSYDENTLACICARAVSGPIANADITLEPMPMVSLSQNSPNPFTGSTRISYKLREASPVRLQIFNIKGQLVHELPSLEKAAGEHSWDWDGRDAGGKTCATGIYLYKVHSGRYSASKKMILLR
ncbi:MAG: T9SS type A sorting domain-containing protein [Candidatus Cloacimonetes bacterium]|nr:T9SS type A sorting domain-containing protein [Candidatus Cloacimonadota bacterium]MCB5288083.1 T9SS type A sorting domain-containing protein [Candidatus Cloacimonadota bacterium]MCK9183748.1 T9SS type A sorting domain-containing protein [Candidatus Cloacimonadota bacterium]MCK9583457.1 T9SS type A sorting domain-containing protein [Candidatus Cloacimonadota bacterium]MDY0230406.1 FlgD immunoglobulin-like domain containing protein [Candidatus Cloacimonadaceae bacterium]